MTSDLASRDCGPCLSGADPVRLHLPRALSPLALDLIRARLRQGERTYGGPLRVGWAEAEIEAVQEAADLVAYLVAGRAPAGLLSDAVGLLEGVLRWHGRSTRYVGYNVEEDTMRTDPEVLEARGELRQALVALARLSARALSYSVSPPTL